MKNDISKISGNVRRAFTGAGDYSSLIYKAEGDPSVYKCASFRLPLYWEWRVTYSTYLRYFPKKYDDYIN